MPEMHDLNDMYLFAKVIEHGGYAAAARALGIATSKVSRRVSELERGLGVQLVHRTTRSLSLTDVGENFYRHCLAMISEAEAACEAVDRARSTPRGLVRISCPVALLFTDVGAILLRYMADHPAVRVNLVATNRRVDVVEDGFDLALRVSAPPLDDSQLVVRTLGVLEPLLVCSPWFIAQHAEPASAEDLAKMPTLSVRNYGNRYTWVLVDDDGNEITVSHTPRFVTDDLPVLREAALEGLGIAMLPRSLVRSALADGSLVQVLPQLRQANRIVHVVFPSRRGLIPAVRALIDALVAGFSVADETRHGLHVDAR